MPVLILRSYGMTPQTLGGQGHIIDRSIHLLLIDLCAPSQTELLLKLINLGNRREEVDLSTSDLVELTWTLFPLVCRSLRFFEIDQNRKVLAWKEIPVFE
mmetsp:Transcript_14376/g.34409  ORF Transcript_14376/g.34409 Transcript_14376/m.34409 type:complete len:100 (+) Transcript_14376:861-1160(+)